MRECVVIGRGFNYATAFELALKLKELTYTLAEPYSSADFLHRPGAWLSGYRYCSIWKDSATIAVIFEQTRATSGGNIGDKR